MLASVKTRSTCMEKSMNSGFEGMTLAQAETEMGMLEHDLEYFSDLLAQTETEITQLGQYIQSLQPRRARKAKTARNTKRNHRSTR